MPQFEFFSDVSDEFRTAATRLNERLNASVVKEIGYALCEAADKRDVDGFRLILSKYPDQINARNADNDTPFILACNMGSEKLVDLALAQPGIDINAQGGDGMTAVMWACEHNYTDIGKTLLQRPNINVTLKDEDGDTALILATQSENSELVRRILQFEEVNVEDKDIEGASARSIAESFKGDTFDQREILELIKAHKSYDSSPAPHEAAAEVAARQGNDRPTTQVAAPGTGELVDFRSVELARLASHFQFPHAFAFLRWADSQGFGDIRHASKRIVHEGKPLLTPQLRNFVIDENALYGDNKTRSSYDSRALTICTHIGYDPKSDYPLHSGEARATTRPPEAGGP